MVIYDANYWELFYPDYPKTQIKKSKSKKEKKILRKAHNNAIKKNSSIRALDMAKSPSELEKRMQIFLNSLNINYEFQKVLHIKNRQGDIQRYYIVDFYIPEKNLIIETDGKFHDDQVKQDERRTKDIKYHYPNMHIIRWRWHDFDSLEKIKDLTEKLK